MELSPGMPANVTSKGMVTCRSTSSADAPGNKANTSTIAGAGSGKASTLTFRKEKKPTAAKATPMRMTTSGLLSDHSMSLRTIRYLKFQEPRTKFQEPISAYRLSIRNSFWDWNLVLGSWSLVLFLLRLRFQIEQLGFQFADAGLENQLAGPERLLA